MTQTVEAIVEYLSAFPRELVVFLISAMPVIELRGGIPAGVALGLPVWEAMLFAVLGNLVPVVFILIFLEPVGVYLRRTYLRNFMDRLYARLGGQQGSVNRMGFIGLFLFVVSPLPGSGVWSGAAAAVVLGLPKMIAFLVIGLATLITGLAVAGIVHLGFRFLG